MEFTLHSEHNAKSFVALSEIQIYIRPNIIESPDVDSQLARVSPAK